MSTKLGGFASNHLGENLAHLQSQFCTKDFFEVRILLRKMLRNFPRKICEPLFCGSEKKTRKIPSKFPTNFSKFPCEKSKEIHRRASAGAQGEHLGENLSGFGWFCCEILSEPSRKLVVRAQVSGGPFGEAPFLQILIFYPKIPISPAFWAFQSTHHSLVRSILWARLKGRNKGDRESRKTQIFAGNRRFLQIHPFSWKFKHLEGAGNRTKPQIRRKPKGTAVWALSP